MKENNNNNNIQLVNLGLPSGTLWTDRNIGADSPEQVGLYYAWGETEGFTDEQVVAGVRSFNRSSYKAKEITADLTPEQDAARAYLGENFHMPTWEDFGELLANCKATWTDNYKGTKVSGHVFTSKTNGNSIFFPVAGFCCNSSVFGSDGDYWSASWYSSSYAWGLDFNFGSQTMNNARRFYGQPVRGVCKSVGHSSHKGCQRLPYKQ